MINENHSPARQALLALTNSLHEAAYFIPKEVKDQLSDASQGPIAVIKPWKKYDLTWYVFPCPTGEAELLKETLGVTITHLFVSTRWRHMDMMRGENLFRYSIGQFDESSSEWRYVDPEKADQDTQRLTSWKKAEVRYDMIHADSQTRRRSGWFS